MVVDWMISPQRGNSVSASVDEFYPDGRIASIDMATFPALRRLPNCHPRHIGKLPLYPAGVGLAARETHLLNPCDLEAVDSARIQPKIKAFRS
jgi:hypothetical protein